MRRYWKPRSISTKLFALTSVLLVAFLTVLMIVQSNFFESYYQNKKINQLQDGLADFKNRHYKSQADLNALPRLFPELEMSLSATAAIVQLKDGLVTMGPQAKTKAIVQMDKNGNMISTPGPILPAMDSESIIIVKTALNMFRNDVNLSRKVINLGGSAAFLTRTPGTASKYIAAMLPLTNGPGGSTDYVLLAVTSLQPVGKPPGS